MTPASFLKTMWLLLECTKREERAEGVIFNPFTSKAEKKVLLIWNRDERTRRAGRFGVPAPHSPAYGDSWTPACGRRDSEGGRGASRGIPAGHVESWDLGAGQPWGDTSAPLTPQRGTRGLTAHGSQYGTHIFKPELNREMVTIQFIWATFWLFSVWTATLKNKQESTENSEVALSSFAFFFFFLN